MVVVVDNGGGQLLMLIEKELIGMKWEDIK